MIFIHKISNWYFRRRSLPYWAIVLTDLFVLWAAYNVSYVMFRSLIIRWGNNPELAESLPRLFVYANSRIAILLLLYLIGMRVFRTYNGIIRYSTVTDLLRVSGAMLIGGGLSYFVHFWMVTLPDFVVAGAPQLQAHIRTRDIVLATFMATVFSWLLRMAVKVIYDLTYRSAQTMRTAIYGIRNDGVAIASAIASEKPKRFTLKVFVTDTQRLSTYRLLGKRVLSSSNPTLVHDLVKHGIQAFLVAPQNISAFRANRELQQELIEAKIKIFVMPKTNEWHDGEPMQQLREIRVEDLLSREEIKVDFDEIGRAICGKKVMVTGSAGSIGSEIVRQVAKFHPHSLMLIDQAETPQHDIRLMMKKEFPEIVCETVVTSICRKDRMEEIFEAYRPHYVFHAAAYKHVPMMEDNPSEAVLNNVLGTQIIADLSVKVGVDKFVMISTDKAVNPTNVMGCSKRICEIYTQSLNQAEKEGRVKGKTKFVTTRFGNVLGSNGSVIPLFRQQLAEGGPLTVTHKDIIRFFMLISEAVKLVLEAGTQGKGGEIFVFDMGEPVRISDLAHNMIMLSGRTDVKVVYTGLRDGEKLYEETLNEAETTLPSFHEKINIAVVRDYDYDDACKQLEGLYAVARGFDDMATVKGMKQIVPEYKSKHSKYEVLDGAPVDEAV